jgi:hypothetical protein
MRSMDEGYQMPKSVSQRIVAKVREWDRDAEYDNAVEKVLAHAERILDQG